MTYSVGFCQAVGTPGSCAPNLICQITYFYSPHWREIFEQRLVMPPSLWSNTSLQHSQAGLVIPTMISPRGTGIRHPLHELLSCASCERISGCNFLILFTVAILIEQLDYNHCVVYCTHSGYFDAPLVVQILASVRGPLGLAVHPTS
jgi:hypothetical protein